MYKLLLLSLSLLWLPDTLAANRENQPIANIPDQSLDGLDRYVTSVMEFTQVPGVAIAVVKDDEAVLAQGYGFLEVDKDAAVDENTLFAIASVTKSFTATALGILVDEGKLSWDQPLSRYLPQLRFSESYLFDHLTVADALSHRTGLQPSNSAWAVYPGKSQADTLGLIEALPRTAPFRASFVYNNMMYMAAGQVIPALAGEPWEAFLRHRLFAPLGMKRTNTRVGDLPSLTNVATPHALTPDGAVPIPYYNGESIAPAGAINSSAADMAQWCRVQLGDGRIDNRQIIPESVIAEMRKPHNLWDLAKEGHIGTRHKAYTYGLVRQNYGNDLIAYFHTGSLNGMGSYFGFIPDADVCVVVLSNGTASSGVARHVANYIFDHLLKISTRLELTDQDYLNEFKKAVEKRQAAQSGLRQAHQRAHDPSTAPDMAPSLFTGKFTDALYGEFDVENISGTLHFRYGTYYHGVLAPHRNVTFDLILDDADLYPYSPAPMTVSYSFNNKGVAESILLEQPKSPEVIRFATQLE